MAFGSVYSWISGESLWLPRNVSGHRFGWKDLQNKPGSNIYLPQLLDIQWSFILGVVLVVLRYVLEGLILAPLAIRLGIPVQRRRRITPNPVLESAYMDLKKRPPDLKALSKQTDKSIREIEIWLRDRKKMDTHTILQKFCDSGWHFIFYATAFTYGLNVMWNKPWFHETIECWKGWPKQHVSNDIYWYYVTELAFYWSLIFTLVKDPKRSDFYQMLIHHVATIILMNFSWMVNFVRIGTLVLIVHDVADPLLELTKMVNYLKWKRTTDCVFVVFVIAWITSRHIVFPYAILYSTTFEISEVLEVSFVNYFFNFFLYLLLALGFIWTYHLMKAVVKKLSQGEVTDTRSDSENEDSPIPEQVANGKS